MTHVERLADIEKLQVPSGNPTYHQFSESDKNFLLTQVRALQARNEKLRKALEYYSKLDLSGYEYDLYVSLDNFTSVSDLNEVARKALADEGEE